MVNSPQSVKYGKRFDRGNLADHLYTLNNSKDKTELTHSIRQATEACLVGFWVLPAAQQLGPRLKSLSELLIRNIRRRLDN